MEEWLFLACLGLGPGWLSWQRRLDLVGRWKGEAGMSSPCTPYYVRDEVEENGGRGGSRGAWWMRKWKWDKTMHCIYA